MNLVTFGVIGVVGGSGACFLACSEVRRRRIVDHVGRMQLAFELGVKAGQESYWLYDGAAVPKDPGVVGHFNPRANRLDRARLNEDCATVAYLRGKAEGFVKAAEFDMHDGFTDLLGRQAA